MYTENQLQKLALIREKWATWEKSRVSLFTHEDRKIINELRAASGLSAFYSGCNACFMDAVRELVKKAKDV